MDGSHSGPGTSMLNQHPIEEEQMADRVLGPGAKGDPENPEMSHADVAASADEATKEELYEQAQELDIEGRSSMSKDELADAVTDEASEPATTTTTRKGR